MTGTVVLSATRTLTLHTGSTQAPIVARLRRVVLPHHSLRKVRYTAFLAVNARPRVKLIDPRHRASLQEIVMRRREPCLPYAESARTTTAACLARVRDVPIDLFVRKYLRGRCGEFREYIGDIRHGSHSAK